MLDSGVVGEVLSGDGEGIELEVVNERSLGHVSSVNKGGKVV